MNFEDLYKKIAALDEGTLPVAPTKDDGGAGASDESIEECGDMMAMGGPAGMPQGQQDNVSMNINMSGQGSGGIRDLMNILRDIDNVGEPSSDKGPSPDDILFGVEEEFANAQDGAPEQATMPVDAVLPTGDDLSSKGKEAPKVNGGGNPMQDELASKLAELYQSIKEGKKSDKDDFDPLKHVKNPTKGEKDAAKDVKRGSYADRAAMLKSAEADGRLKEAKKETEPEGLYSSKRHETDGQRIARLAKEKMQAKKKAEAK